MKEKESKNKNTQPISVTPRRYEPSVILKTCILAAMLVLFMVIEIIIIGSAARNTTSSVTYSNYISAAAQTANKLSGKMEALFSSDESAFEKTGSLSGNTITVDGASYSVKEETQRVNLLSGRAVICELSEIANGASSEAYIIIPKDIVSSYYKEPEEDDDTEDEDNSGDEDNSEDRDDTEDGGDNEEETPSRGDDTAENTSFAAVSFAAEEESATLYFCSLESIKSDLLSGSVEGFAILSSTGRIIWSDSGALQGYISDYSENLPESLSTVYVSSTDSAMALCVESVGDDFDYYVCVFDDFVAREASYTSLTGTIAIVVGACSAMAIAAFVVMTMWQLRGEGSFKARYHITTDLNGKIIIANNEFKTNFPKIVEIQENIAYFEPSEYNVLRVKNKEGTEMTLACTVEQRSDKLNVHADILSLPVGKDILTAGESMSRSYEVFRETDKRNLVGYVNIGNLGNFKSMFGDEFAELVYEQIYSKLAEKFVFVYDDGDKTVGVLVHDGKDLENMLQDLPDIVAYVNKPVAIEGNLVNPDVKFGFALVDATMTDTSFKYVHTAANAALTRASKDSDKQYYIYQEAQKKTYAKYFISYDIPKMLEDNAFEMQYQPQYSIKEERIVGFEALFRVKANVMTNVNVFDLITYAERTGMMILLSEFIFDTGMRFAKRIEGKGVAVSLNVSPIQLMQAGFVDSFLKLYEKYQLQPGSICVEITESFLMTTFDETVKKLDILRNAGIEIHLDDFGTRYSSLLYLKKLPISTIKIDKEFIDDICKNGYSHAVTQMVIDLSFAMDLSNISEGVETMDQYLTLKKMGGDIVQGYLIGKSAKEDAAAEMIDTFKLEIPDEMAETAENAETVKTTKTTKR